MTSPSNAPAHGATARSAAGYVRTLLMLEREAFSGVLSVKAEGVATHVHFRQGTIVSASGGTVSDSLGRLLVRRGTISHEAYAEAIHKVTDTLVDDELMRLGEVLVELGHMSGEAVHEALALQVRRKVLRGLQYDRVEMVLQRGASRGETGRFPMKVAPLLVEAARSHVGTTRAAAMLQPLRGSFVALRAAPAEIARRLALTPQHARALEHIDGRRETWQLLATLGTEGLDPIPLVVALFLADCLQPLPAARPDDEDVPSERPPPPRRAAPRGPSVFRSPRSTQGSPQRPRPRTRTSRRTEPFPESARSGRPTWRREDLPRRQAGTHRALAPREASSQAFDTSPGDPAAPDSAEDRRKKLAAEEAYRRGMLHLWAQRLAQASDSFQAAAALDPTHLEYQLCALWVTYRRAKAPDVIARLQGDLAELAPQVAAQDRSIAFAPYVLAHLALLAEDEVRALRLFRVAAEREPDNVDAARHVRLLTRRRGSSR